MTGDDNSDMTAPHEALWDAVQDGDAARLAALFRAVPALRDVADDIHPRHPFAKVPLEPVLNSTNPLTDTYPLHHAAHLGYGDVCTILLDNGATPDGRWQSETPLTLAARGGKLAVAQLLLDRGADVDGLLREPAREVPGDGGLPWSPSALGPMHYAAQRGDEQMVGLLLERGATCDLPDADGDTALHHAGRANAVEVVWRLMIAGGNEHLKNESGETPFEVGSVLWGVLPTDSVDHWSAAGVMQYCARLARLIARTGGIGWEMEASGVSAWIPASWRGGPWAASPWAGGLWDALRRRDTPTVERLLRDDTRLARARHPSGATALHLTVYDAELTRRMIELGADLNARDAAGDTALHLAARQSADASAWHLIRGDASPWVHNHAFCIPYDIAHGYEEEWPGGCYVGGTWKCDIPPHVLFNEFDDRLDFSALTDVRDSGIMCTGCDRAPMLIVPFEGKKLLFCGDPACQHTAVPTDVMGAGDAAEAAVVTSGD